CHSHQSDLFIQPTIIHHIQTSRLIIQQQIFPPLLPIITYHQFHEPFHIIHSPPKPLTLYLFTQHQNSTHPLLNQLPFPGAAINHTLIHLPNPNLPFGRLG
ncbi:aldehyde dehydrogenase family protein, partial [Staphylococcus warneri]|uniref:aldehyde dehydrogenase family protein n=1 Tax=Staphylococcus warneri TaxID=1292 RepID=UPI0011A8F7A4